MWKLVVVEDRVPLFIFLSLSDLELTTVIPVNHIRNHSHPITTQRMPSHWVVQLHWRTKSLPIYSHDHTLWAGLTNRFLEAGHLSLIHSTTHQITCNTMCKINSASKTATLFRTKYTVASICRDERNENGLQAKNPSTDDRIKLNFGVGIWLLKCLCIISSLDCINHLPSLTGFYIFIVLNVYIKENVLQLINTNSELLEHVMAYTYCMFCLLSRISFPSSSHAP